MKRFKLWFISFWAAAFLWFWSHAITYDKEGNLIAGHANIWGDWAAHFTMGSAMAFRQLFLTTSPFVLDAPFRYPFVADLLSALLVRSGVPFFASFVWPSFLFSVGCAAGIFLFYRAIFQSDRTATLASLIFLLAGGLGAFQLLSDAWKSSEPFQVLFFPPHPVTWRIQRSLYFVTPITSMIVPQRAFAMAFPLVLLFLYRSAHFLGVLPSSKSPPTSDRKILLWGLFWGLLPLLHTHTFFSVSVVIGLWAVACLMIPPLAKQPPLRPWILLGAVAVPLASFFCFFYFRTPGHGLPLPRFFPGWLAPTAKLSWPAFWLLNWSITPFVAAGGAYLLAKSRQTHERRLAWFLLSFTPLFALGNLFLFQPWPWDNTKIILWSVVGAAGLAAAACARLWDMRKELTRPRWQRFSLSVLAPLLFFLMTVSGAVDTYRLMIPTLNSLKMYTKEELDLADWVRSHTPVDSIWVTAAYHNHWLFTLTGRQPVMSYEGWLWTHGYDYVRYKNAAQAMLSEPEKSLNLFDSYNVDYAVVGPIERRDNGAKETEFARLFTPVLQTATYTIYHTSPEARRIKNTEPITIHSSVAAVPDPAWKHGLSYRIYRGTSGLGKPISTRLSPELPVFRYEASDDRPFPKSCFLSWEGYVEAKSAGLYRFFLSSDDGSMLYLDENLVIDNGGIHENQERVAAVRLEKGFHRIRVTYFDESGGAAFRLFWAPPAGTLSPLPAHQLFTNP